MGYHRGFLLDLKATATFDEQRSLVTAGVGYHHICLTNKKATTTLADEQRSGVRMRSATQRGHDQAEHDGSIHMIPTSVENTCTSACERGQ